MENTKQAGWVLIEPETDEFYGRVQYRDEFGNMTDRIEVCERRYDGNGYSFSKSGLGELILLK